MKVRAIIWFTFNSYIGFFIYNIAGKEYLISNFTLLDGTYGSVFYFGTGFYDFHLTTHSAYTVLGFWHVSLLFNRSIMV